MGIAMSVVSKAMGKMGLPVNLSSITDRIFDQFFSKDIKNFEQFHNAYLDACNKFNSVMLGQHYEAPDRGTIKTYYEQWDKMSTADEKKKYLIDQLTKDVTMSKTNQAVVVTGLVVPPAAMILKKTGEKAPQVRKFRLDFIPDVLFVPTVTLVALFGVKAVRRNQS